MISEKNIRLGMAFLFGCIITMNMTLMTNNDVTTDNRTMSTTKASALRYFQSNPNHLDVNNNNTINRTNNSNNENLLNGIRILVAITAFDFSQIPHLEEVVDSYLDLCVVSGIQKLDIVIYTTVAFSVTLIDLWNTRIPTSCKHNNIFSLTIIVKPYKMRLFLVDCHRYLFYEKLTDYDLFIYTEDDMVVHPKTIAAYLEETQRLQQLVGLEKSSNYNVGIVRYEYNFPSNVVMDDNTRHSTQNVTRVYWEHFTKPMFTHNTTKKAAASRPIPNTPELSQTHIHMTNHHQGMYLVTQYLLEAWAKKERGPDCDFSRVRKHPNTPTQRVWMSSFMMYGYPHSKKGTPKGACQIQQVLPIDTFGSLTVYHLPNKNHRRVKTRLAGEHSKKEKEFLRSTGDEPDFDFGDTQNQLVSAMRFHIEISKQHQQQHNIQSHQDYQSTDVPYNGIRMIDQRHSGSGDGSSNITEEQGGDAPEDIMTIDNDRFRDYHAYVERGGIMSLGDMEHTDLMEGDALARQTTLRLKNQKSNKAKLEAKAKEKNNVGQNSINSKSYAKHQKKSAVKHPNAAIRLEKKAKAKAKADAAVLNFDSRQIPEETVAPTEGDDDTEADATVALTEDNTEIETKRLQMKRQKKEKNEQQFTQAILKRKEQRNKIGTHAEICEWYGMDCGDLDPQDEQEQQDVIDAEQNHDYDRNRHPLYYELWNHTTDTITIPNELRPDYESNSDHNNTQKYKPTSLELLQSVLHGEENENEYVAVEEHVRTNLSDTSNSRFRTSLPLPQCLLPNKVATRKLADEIMMLLSQNTTVTNTLLPVLNVGFAKLGTSTLADFFLCAGYYTTHDKVGNKYLSREANQQYTWNNNKGPMMGDLHEGIELSKRAKKNAQHNYQNNNKSDTSTSTSTHHTSLLDYHKQYTTPENKPIEAHCQLDTNRVEGFYPQVKLLDELHADQPNSTFVLLFRPIHDWLNSIDHWAGIKDRMSRFEMPGLILSATQKEDIQLLRKWHIEHYVFAQLSKSSKFQYVNDYYQTLLQNPIHPQDNSTNGIALSVQYRTFHEYQNKLQEQTKINVVGGAADFIPLENPVGDNNVNEDNAIDVDHNDTNNITVVQVKRPQQYIFPFKRPPVPEPVDDIQLTRWWCGHVKHIREFVKQYPSHKLIELDLYDTEESSTVLHDLFQKNQKRIPGNDNNDKSSCWGHANMNKKAQKVK